MRQPPKAQGTNRPNAQAKGLTGAPAGMRAFPLLERGRRTRNAGSGPPKEQTPPSGRIDGRPAR